MITAQEMISNCQNRMGSLFPLMTVINTNINQKHSNSPSLRLKEVQLTIPQVDYENAIYYKHGDPLPYLDFKKVEWHQVIEKEHKTVIIENEFVSITILPEMGRVYSMIYRPTGHETLWQNDIVHPGGANNEIGWWLWIGGIEYTLPKDEHGTSWALDWNYEILTDTETCKTLRMQVKEPTSSLDHRVDLSLIANSSALKSDVSIWNPTCKTVNFAHWVNPMWAPGGHNQLTDQTKFIIPTKQVLIEERWQENLGPSPQSWVENPLRYICNWPQMGDLMADGLEAGFYGVYSHDEEEGVVRVFDPDINPGVDIWTYGFKPEDIPMGSGGKNEGYVEIWGGTVKHFPDQTAPLLPGETIGWSEWIYPFQKTKGLSIATENVALHHRSIPHGLEIFICPSIPINSAQLKLQVSGETVSSQLFSTSPDAPYQTTIKWKEIPIDGGVVLILSNGEEEILRIQP